MIRADEQNSKSGAIFNGRLTIFTLPIMHHVGPARKRQLFGHIPHWYLISRVFNLIPIKKIQITEKKKNNI